MSAGYSQTPLVKKLGIKAGNRIMLVQIPDHYPELIGAFPPDIAILETAEAESLHFIHLFCQEKVRLVLELKRLKPLLLKHGMLWISWPKGKSNLPTDLNGNIVRETGLAAGLVDVKVAAIDEDWSGLKFMYRIKDR